MFQMKDVLVGLGALLDQLAAHDAVITLDRYEDSGQFQRILGVAQVAHVDTASDLVIQLYAATDEMGTDPIAVGDAVTVTAAWGPADLIGVAEILQRDELPDPEHHFLNVQASQTDGQARSISIMLIGAMPIVKPGGGAECEFHPTSTSCEPTTTTGGT